MRKHRITAAAVAAGGALALLLSGCSGGGSGDASGGTGSTETATTDYNPQPRENLQQGGEVTFPISEITPQLNPNQGDGSVDTSRLWAWSNPQPILMSPEGEASANPNYLTDWTTEEVDGKTVVTYTINPEAVYNDGTPIDWRSFEQTWIANRSYDEGYQPSATDGYALIESVTQGVDDRQAVVTFSQTYPWSDGLFWNLLNPNVNTPEIFNEGYLGNPHPEWGAGPYKIDSFDANGGVVTFVPNETWWGDPGLLDTVTFRQLDDQAMINAFRAGEIDYADNLTADNLAQIGDADDTTIYRAQRTSTNLLQLDADKPQFADLEVRQAIFMGIDREQIKEVVWNGLDYSEADVNSFNLFPFQDGYVDSLTEAGWSYDPDAASQMLEDAGWTLNDDGVREKDGVLLEGTLPLFGDDPIVEARGRVVQTQLAAIGMDVELDVRPTQDFSSDFSSKNWDLMMLGFSSSDPFGVAYMCQLYCSDSSLNLSATSTTEIDDEIADQVSSLPTGDEQIAAAGELEPQVMADTWGIFPIYSGPWISAARTGLANLTPEMYTGLDLFGVQPVENVGWEK